MPSADKRQRKKDNARAAREARQAAEKRRRQIRTARNVGIFVAFFVALIVVVNLLTKDNGKKKSDAATTSTTVAPTTVPVTYPAGCVSTVPKPGTKPTYKSPPPMTIDVNKTYIAHMKTSCGEIDITLDAKDAPKTVNSFVFLAKNHFYDGLSFHRLVQDFVIQGGDPQGTGNGGPGYTLPDEPPKNGYKQGSVAMANAGSGTTGSQFFIALSENGAKGLGTTPPYKYSALGTVTKGFDNVQKMAKLASGGDGPPLKPLYILSVTITES